MVWYDIWIRLKMRDWSSKNASQWLEHSVLEQFPGTEKHHWDFKIEKDGDAVSKKDGMSSNQGSSMIG